MPSSETVPLTAVQSVNRALDYIEVNLAGQLSLSLIAGAACVSPFHFQRMFRAVMGETPHAFVLRRRLENALGDISQGNRQPLTDIALSRGFSSYRIFPGTSANTSDARRENWICIPAWPAVGGRWMKPWQVYQASAATAQTMRTNFRSRCAISRSARSNTFVYTGLLRKAPSRRQPCAWWRGHEALASSIINGWAISGINLVWRLRRRAGMTLRWRSCRGVIAVRSAVFDCHP